MERKKYSGLRNERLPIKSDLSPDGQYIVSGDAGSPSTLLCTALPCACLPCACLVPVPALAALPALPACTAPPLPCAEG